MASSIDDVCNAIAGAISQVDGLRAKGYMTEQVNEPDVHIFIRDFDPRMVFRSDKRTIPMTARLFLKGADSRTAQVAARSYMEPTGSTSVTEKIEASDEWVGVTVDYAVVTLITAPDQIEVGAIVRWFVDFEFDVCW